MKDFKIKDTLQDKLDNDCEMFEKLLLFKGYSLKNVATFMSNYYQNLESAETNFKEFIKMFGDDKKC